MSRFTEWCVGVVAEVKKFIDSCLQAIGALVVMICVILALTNSDQTAAVQYTKSIYNESVIKVEVVERVNCFLFSVYRVKISGTKDPVTLTAGCYYIGILGRVIW